MHRHRARVRALVLAIAIPASVLGVACAAVLAIDDRALDTPDGAIASDASGGGEDVAPVDSATDASGPSTCDPGCAASGGRCDASTCVIDCTRGCTDPVVCPEAGACHIVCGDGGCSTGVTCRNDVSCKIDCVGDYACHRGVTCESPTCDIDCRGPNACRNDPGIMCDAAVCKIACSGSSSCNRPILANASARCDIDCTGSPSCTNGRVQCLSPEAGIRCNGVSACANGKPWCSPPDSGALDAGEVRDAGECAIVCGPDTTSCTNNYCCQSASCSVTVDAGTRTNICP